MADIVTNTLQIGSNNLILQDAEARQNIATNTQDISDLKDGLSDLSDDLNEAIEEFAVPTQEAVDNWLNAHPEATTTVQDGAISASKLNSALLKDYQKSGTAMVFFPSLENGGYSGSTALMVAEGKTILFDAAPETNKTAVMAYYQSLYNAGVFSNIDIIVISHFHWDHYECLGYILEAFPHSNCKAYIPQSPSGYYTESDASSILASRTEVIETLEQYGVTINEVSTDTTVSVSENFVSIELFNSTTSDYTYYSSNTTDYNNYSMVSLVKVGDIYAMFPADIKRVAQDRIISQRTLPRLFLYAVHHHGMEDGDNVQYLDMISPEWSIIQTSHNRQLISGAVGMAANYSTTHLCSTAYGSYAFVMQKNGGYIVDGADIERSGWYYNYFDLYVDNEYTGTVFDGSQEHPFTSINEVNLFIKDDRNLHYRVYVKATSTEYDLLWMRDYGCTVEFYGVANGNILKPTINGVYIRACTNIYFTGMILKTGRTTNNIKSVCYVSESTVYFNGCEIDGNDRSGVNGIQTHLAQAYVSDSTIKNCSDAFVPYRFGNVITNGISFDNVNCCYRQSNQEITIRGTDTINNINSFISSYSANGAIPVKISSVTLSDFKTLCTKNSNVAISEVFRAGNNLYKVEGANVMSPATWTAGDLFAKRITDDLNNAVEFGFYSYTTNASNRPTGLANDSGGLLVFGYSAKYLTQIATVNDGNALNIAVRKCVNGSFGSWHILTAT